MNMRGGGIRVVGSRLMLAVLVLGLLGSGITPTLGAQVQGELTSLSAPLTLKSGQTGEFEVRIRNTGSLPWTNSGANAVKIGTASPRDRSSNLYTVGWLNSNRASSAAAATVMPGETGVFNLPVRAGIAGGTIVEKFGLVMEGIEWAALEFAVTVKVEPAIWAASWTTDQPTTLNFEIKAGEVVESTIRLKNTGETEWISGGNNTIKLGTVSPFDRTSALRQAGWVSANRVAGITGSTSPGGEAEIRAAFQAPAKPGTYREEFGIVAEGVAWLSPRLVVEMKVVPAIYTAAWVQQSPGPILAPGSETQLWVEFRNTGNVVWRADGAAATRLGTARPLDRHSDFRHSTWINDNRTVAMTPAVVNPGEIARFTFSIQAPQRVGSYREYFRPVIETVSWLTDVGLYWDIAVEEEMVIRDNIRVGITSTTDPITISGENFAVRRMGDRGLVRKVTGSVVVTPIGGGYQLNTGEVVNDALRIVPLNGTVLEVNTGGIGSTYDRFRGILVVQRSSIGNVWVVNHLELEDYMKGIAEVPEGWPAEAQKAQMVAARTFAVKKRMESVASDIFDVYDDTRHQVYYGYNYEVPRPNLVAAAVATRGLVMKYQGQPISAYYFSDSGGATEASHNVWGQGNPALAIPYLQGVPDPYAKPIDWSATLTQGYLQQRFDQELRVAGNETIATITVTEKFPSGRAKTVVFTMNTGRLITVPFYRFDYLTNNQDIKSMIFNVVPVPTATGVPDFNFTGKGWGHGVGLAQWGARNMADQGFDFNRILTYYYTGVSVDPL